ncbi:hypothetical protein O181_004268 [Austropuccinia psidii MF-1]|uniref:adenosylmethionine decarboxylase n=1 Tax=Austropuccinia psidii MF-1 TaxID=1389203 RepID=A0A9Q3BG10_9BASI|nr:hypothetical protein [Austropuccinia psidii MF-1]
MSQHSSFIPNTSVSILLDDSSFSGPFEGPEKLLEIWFAASPDAVPLSHNLGTRIATPAASNGTSASQNLIGLRTVDKAIWQAMLDQVKCKVLSVIESEQVDAYLLSESSMFVWPHKIILKTCGTTTLLLGLPTLLKIAKDTCGFANIWQCFYSRKTFMFPERQSGPHKDWGQEVKYLDGIFENGSAYTVGKINGDHWLLYLTSPKNQISTASLSIPPKKLLSTSTPTNNHHHVPNKPIWGLPERDSTLEILMSGLSEKACAQFYSSTSILPTRYPNESSPEGHAPGLALSVALGLDADSLLGGGRTDGFLFAPCGFSVNMVGGIDNKRYATIHVTPEAGYSYASFECNVDYCGRQSELVNVVERVLRVFEPNRMSITLFTSHDPQTDFSINGTYIQDNFRPGFGRDLVQNYKRTDRILYEFDGYDLVFATFERL